jgi:general secretion pathway protein E
MKIRRGAEEMADLPADAGEVAEMEHVSLLAVDIPYAFAKKNGVVLREPKDKRVTVALCEGFDPTVLLEVRRYLALPFDVEIADRATFDRYLSEHYSVDGSAAQIVDEFYNDQQMLGDFLPTAEDLLDSADDAPVIRLINGIIAEAVRQGASDIHIEPYENRAGGAPAQ